MRLSLSGSDHKGQRTSSFLGPLLPASTLSVKFEPLLTLTTSPEGFDVPLFYTFTLLHLDFVSRARTCSALQMQSYSYSISSSRASNKL
jgi:hypothetical protein